MPRISRRNFLATVGSGTLGLGLFRSPSVAFGGDQAQPKIIKYNPLGNTGLRVADVSCGAISFNNPNVMRYAFDCGINYFDTAEGYLRTKSETFIGEALKDVRDQVVITTKHPMRGPQDLDQAAIVKRVEESLKRLQTDRIDVAMVHGPDSMESINHQAVQEAYARLKKEGKVRFTGFSTHNAKVMLKEALSSDFTQVVLIIYNHLEGAEIEPLIEAVRKKGIGTVAMKVFAGGMQGNLQRLVSRQLSYPQAAIRWVLSNPYIDACIPTMSSFSHVEEYVAASGKKLKRSDLALISRYRQRFSDQYCRVSCRECLPACPRGVAVNEVLRFAMYFENYGMEKEAMRYYAGLDERQRPLGCADCSGYCQQACPHGLKVRERLLHSHRLLRA